MSRTATRRVRVYGDGWRDFGAVRFEVSWEVISDSFKAQKALEETSDYRADFNPDSDSLGRAEHFDTEAAALKRAQEIFDTSDDLTWGVVTVQKQVVDWYVEEDGIAEWRDDGDSIEISEAA